MGAARPFVLPAPPVRQTPVGSRRLSGAAIISIGTTTGSYAHASETLNVTTRTTERRTAAG
jgi:hypothetical protein